MQASTPQFGGSIPDTYEKYLVPLIFEPYAVDLARRVRALQPARLLELAAGTGVVTRHLAHELRRNPGIVATDLSPAMLGIAARTGTERAVEWLQADALDLPFDDASFDAVVCQFGVMFFPDQARAFSEARRVLKPGGAFVFSVWDQLELNEFPATVSAALAGLFPANPPDFMQRIPHGYHDLARIRADLAAGGFTAAANIDTVKVMSRAESAQNVAVAFCQGTPLRNEIDMRAPGRIAEITAVVTEALANRFGRGAIEGAIQAHVITVLA